MRVKFFKTQVNEFSSHELTLYFSEEERNRLPNKSDKSVKFNEKGREKEENDECERKRRWKAKIEFSDLRLSRMLLNCELQDEIIT